jgi:hypothetical protein
MPIVNISRWLKGFVSNKKIYGAIVYETERPQTNSPTKLQKNVAKPPSTLSIVRRAPYGPMWKTITLSDQSKLKYDEQKLSERFPIYRCYWVVGKFKQHIDSSIVVSKILAFYNRNEIESKYQ